MVNVMSSTTLFQKKDIHRHAQSRYFSIGLLDTLFEEGVLLIEGK